MYDGEINHEDLFFRRNRLATFGMVRACMKLGRTYWRVDYQGRLIDDVETKDEAIDILLHILD